MGRRKNITVFDLLMMFIVCGLLVMGFMQQRAVVLQKHAAQHTYIVLDKNTKIQYMSHEELSNLDSNNYIVIDGKIMK